MSRTRRRILRRGSAEIVDVRLELIDHLSERHDVQHALALAHDVDEVLARPDEHRVRAVEHEARRRPVVPPPLEARDAAVRIPTAGFALGRALTHWTLRLERGRRLPAK